MAKRPAPFNSDTVNDGKVAKDEGVYPGRGSYHLYHRIDGKLVAVSCLDITTKYLVSQYLMYDPDYAFLKLGVVSAVHELEYMAMIREQFNPDLQYYHLCDFSLSCPKLAYKMNYRPGFLICPRTNDLVSVDKAKPYLEELSKMRIAEKSSMESILQLADSISQDEMTEGELYALAFKEEADNFPFLYKNRQTLTLGDFTEKEPKIKFALAMIKNVGVQCFGGLVLELKFEDIKIDEEGQIIQEEEPKAEGSGGDGEGAGEQD